MEVPGDLGQLKAEQRQLLHGEGEEVLIVRLEVDLPAHLQHLAVQPQEVAVGQAALGVAVAGPGIAEVDIDPVCLSFFKHLTDPGRVHTHKPEIGRRLLQCVHPLQCT